MAMQAVNGAHAATEAAAAGGAQPATDGTSWLAQETRAVEVVDTAGAATGGTESGAAELHISQIYDTRQR